MKLKFEKEKKPNVMASEVTGKDLIVPELKEGQKGLNLGSGFMYLPGWENVDMPPKNRNEKLIYDEMIQVNTEHDLESFPYPWEDDSVDYIILHHVIEHLKYPNDNKCIRECNRILKKGGKLIMHYPHYSGSTAHLSSHGVTLCRNAYGMDTGTWQGRTVRLLYSQFKDNLFTKFIDWFINLWGNYYEKIGICYFPFMNAFEVQMVFVK